MNPTKSFFASGAILGGLLATAIFSIIGSFGFHLDKAQTMGFFAELWELKPVVVGIVSSLIVIWTRIKHIEFNAINWPGLVAAILALLSAAGVDTHDLQHLVNDTGMISAKLPGLIAAGVMIWRVLAANKEIAVMKATRIPVLLLVLMPVLPSCSTWQKLSPEQQARIEAIAINAAAAAATQAVQSAADGKSAQQIATDATRAALHEVAANRPTPEAPVP